MFIVVDGVTIRKDIEGLLRGLKYSQYPWYDEVGVVAEGVSSPYVDQPLGDISHCYAIAGEEQTDFVVNPDVIPSGTLDQQWVDPGAIASDRRDGNLSYTISGTPNLYEEGTTIVTYSTEDSKQQPASIQREVIVQKQGVS